jgi:ubiquinone/menaquinone biosynthesis C-methylase UbiE
VLGVCAVIAAGAAYFIWPYWYADPDAQVVELIRLMQLRPGTPVAEIGAGGGDMTIEMAQRLGPEAQVFSTEIDSDRLGAIRKAAEKAGVRNVSVLEAGEKQTNLPPECCEAVYMRRVYHHFSDPPAINQSLYAALRPGGRLAVIDFPPRLRWLPRPEAVPENRESHGVRQELVIQEVTAAGFELEQRIEKWPGKDYCLVFRKPSEPHAPASGAP